MQNPAVGAPQPPERPRVHQFDHGLSLCVHRLPLCVHRLSLCVHRLSLCVHGLSLCVHRLSLCVRRLSLYVHRPVLSPPPHRSTASPRASTASPHVLPRASTAAARPRVNCPTSSELRDCELRRHLPGRAGDQAGDPLPVGREPGHTKRTSWTVSDTVANTTHNRVPGQTRTPRWTVS